MNLERIGEAFDFYRHTPGSIEYCAAMMRPLLTKRNNTDALDLVDKVEVECGKAREKKYDWVQKKKAEPLRRAGSKEMDNKVDRTLGRLLRAVKPYAEMEGDSPMKVLAKEMISELFPAGVGPITTQRYEDQYASVVELLERLDRDFSTHVEELRLEPLVDQLAEFNEAYGEGLAGDDKGVAHSDVEAARAEAEDAFHRLLIKIMHDYMFDLAELNEILKPFLRQEERLRRHYKRRGHVPEIDPETGEAIDEDGPVDQNDDHAEQPADDEVADPV